MRGRILHIEEGSFQEGSELHRGAGTQHQGPSWVSPESFLVLGEVCRLGVVSSTPSHSCKCWIFTIRVNLCEMWRGF